MGSFTKLIVSPLDDGRTWELIEEFYYHKDDKTSFEIPKGFKTDFASIPRFLWVFISPTGKHDKAAVLHDYLYRTRKVTRRDADMLFLEGMTVQKVASWRKYSMFIAVRLFGWRFYKD